MRTFPSLHTVARSFPSGLHAMAKIWTNEEQTRKKKVRVDLVTNHFCYILLIEFCFPRLGQGVTLGPPPGLGVRWGVWPVLRSPGSTVWPRDRRMKTPGVRWPEGGTWWSKSSPCGLRGVTGTVNQLHLFWLLYVWPDNQQSIIDTTSSSKSYLAWWPQARSGSLSAPPLVPATPGSLHHHTLARTERHMSN